MVIPARPSLIFFIIFLILITGIPNQAKCAPAKGPTFSTREEALAFLTQTKLPDSSAWWPRVNTLLFLQNLKVNIENPLAIYQGSNTNFCGYAALSYIPLHHDPLGYAKFLVTLFVEGQATWNDISFTPSTSVRKAAGSLRFKGILDIRPADQIWFLVLADHFRGYLNFFFPHFHTGSEDTFWAAMNYGKFNRIIRQLFKYQVEARGSDLIRPHIQDIYTYLHDRISPTTFLYVNNNYLYKKDHSTGKASFPTHYIVLEEIWKTRDLITIVYWDYGVRSLRQVSPAFLKKIIFGVTHCTIPDQPNKTEDAP
jgi:hypothetical protein